MSKHLIIALLAALLFVVGCSRNEDNIVETPQETVAPTGKISGTVFAKNGTKAIGGALVFVVKNNGELVYTHSDADGKFILEAPIGMHQLHIQTGGGGNFRTEIPVQVDKDETLVISATQSVVNQVAQIAYVKGSYDKIEDMILNLGYTATEITYQDLKNLNTIAQYDIIFLNCGSRGSQSTGTSNPSADADVYQNLSTFVTNGGSLYTSDWASAYLVGGDVNTTSCNAAGGFIDDSLLCVKNNGVSGYINNCSVSNAALATAVGFTTLDIDYDLGSWEKIIHHNPNFWEVLVQNNNEPLMIRTNQYADPNAPQVAVGTSTNNNFITICHQQAGANPITITINQNAWGAHQAHGDSMGACAGTSTSGNIYFTTFHNHASGNIGNSEKILDYVILNL